MYVVINTSCITLCAKQSHPPKQFSRLEYNTKAQAHLEEQGGALIH